MLKRVAAVVAMVATLVLSLAALGLGAGVPAAEAASPGGQRIYFPAGGTSYTLYTSLAPDSPQSYVLGITAGQALYVTKYGSATVEVLDRRGTVLAGPASEQGPWGVIIPETGDYTVTLAGNGAATVTFEIPSAGQPAPVPGQTTRIRFATGATSATFSTSLQAGTPAGYILGLQAGQRIYVTVYGNASASLLNPYGGAVEETSTGAGQWQFPAKSTGDYELILQGSGAVTVMAYVPPLATHQGATRIRFAPGNAGTSFTANLVDGSPARYVLGMLGGQTLYVQVDPEDATVAVTALDGSAVNTIRSGRPGLWIAAGGQTGDYTITIQGQGITGVSIYIPPL